MATKEMQIQTALRFHLTHLTLERMIFFNKSKYNKSCCSYGEKKNTLTVLVGMQTCTNIVETSM